MRSPRYTRGDFLTVMRFKHARPCATSLSGYERVAVAQAARRSASLYSRRLPKFLLVSQRQSTSGIASTPPTRLTNPALQRAPRRRRASCISATRRPNHGRRPTQLRIRCLRGVSSSKLTPAHGGVNTILDNMRQQTLTKGALREVQFGIARQHRNVGSRYAAKPGARVRSSN